MLYFEKGPDKRKLNIYLEDELGKEANQLANRLRKSRNFVIREALKERVAYHSIAMVDFGA
nr:ribbon-helix-helix protein, CopG family [Coxiella endosymbiont of Ornithodoros amblus]